MITKKMDMARIAIHAPARNLVISTITSTTAVKVSPTALMAREAQHVPAHRRVLLGRGRLRVQCRIMPSWLRVNETKDAHDVELDQSGDLGVEGPH